MSRILAERLKREREKRGWTQVYMAKLLGITNGTLSGYERNYREPDLETLDKITRVLGVSKDYLLNNPAETSVAEAPTPYLTDRANLRLLPVLGVVRAGAPLFAEENIIGYEPANADEIKNGDYFYLRVTGDSMTGSRIQEGDLVLVKKQTYIENGQIAVVMVNSEEATLKRVYVQGEQCILQADNPKYPPVAVPARDLQIIGRVLEGKYKL